jgi:NADH-quinone oxidoreductase subunit N
VITSLFGAFYYLRIVKLMYFDTPQDHAPIEGDRSKRFLLIINGLAVVALGLMPSHLLRLCAQAIGHTLPL